MSPTVMILVEGGLVQDVRSDIDLEVVIVDLDNKEEGENFIYTYTLQKESIESINRDIKNYEDD